MSELIEQKAYSLLERTGCATLPIDVFEIARRCRYNVKSFSKSKKIIETLDLYEYVKTRPAFSIKYKDSYFILVSDELSVDSERKAVAHEIGHIILHENVLGKDGVFINDNCEAEAEEFALKLLAPLPILSSYHLETPENIRKVTRLSISDSKIIYNNLLDYHDKCSKMLKYKKLMTLRTKYSKQNNTIIKISTLICCLICLLLSFTNTHFITPGKNADYSDKTDSYITSSYSEIISSYLSPNITYYWTKSGNYFHTHKDCQSLKNSSEIFRGTLSEAEKAKERLCKFCESRDKEDTK